MKNKQFDKMVRYNTWLRKMQRMRKYIFWGFWTK